jgi:hypothetical protein
LSGEEEEHESGEMCPLRVILIFLSATIAGFFLIRGLNAEPDQFDSDADESETPRAPLPLHSKVTNQRLFSSRPFLLSCRCGLSIAPPPAPSSPILRQLLAGAQG